VPRPERLDLDLPQHLISAHVAVDKAASCVGLRVALEDLNGHVLGEAVSDSNCAVSFEVPSAALVGPTIGELRLRFGGSAQLAPASTLTMVTRFARVHLKIPASVQGDPSSGVRVDVGVATGHGPVTSGTIEARLGEELVGTAAVQDGRAELVMAFGGNRNAALEQIGVRFVSDAPYYQASAPSALRLQVTHPSPIFRGVPVLVALALAAWILRGWWRPKRLERHVSEKAKSFGQASVSVVGEAQTRGSWKGKVVDAYDASSVGAARIRVIFPSFADLDVVVECVADDSGEFEFRVPSYDKQLRLRVEAPLHVELERALPPACDLSIALVSRRRALVDRLIAWAKREGKPWDHSPEPTPGYIGKVAMEGRHKREDVANWAQKLEERAFGPEPVLARDEREVRDIEPGPKALR
jgi:hypothetical protein